MRSSIKLSEKGKKFFASLLILVMVIFLAICNAPKKDYKHEILEGDNYSLKIDYPDIKNKLIAKEAISFIDERKKEFINSIKDLEKKESKYDFSVTYNLSSYNNIDVLHLLIFSYTGGAHYIREDKSYYYNNQTGKELTLNDLLASDDSLSKLSNLAYYYVMEYSHNNSLNLSEEMVREGTEAKLDNFLHFTFIQEGLEILFPPYHVAAWTYGEIKIIIPYNELREVIKEEYIIPHGNNNEETINPKVRSLDEFQGKKLIAFTFDDGPALKSTNKLLDNLDKYNARVTFFVLGSRVNQYKDTLKKAYLQGNQIGSHTYSHLNLLKLNDYDIIREIKNTNKVIKDIIGVEPTLLRPPYGNINKEIKSLADMYTILWDIDTEDWKLKDKNKIAENIVKYAHDGAIVLLHDLYDTSIEGALLAMEQLIKEDYAFVTIEEMIKLKNINLDKEKSYFSIK